MTALPWKMILSPRRMRKPHFTGFDAYLYADGQLIDDFSFSWLFAFNTKDIYTADVLLLCTAARRIYDEPSAFARRYALVTASLLSRLSSLLRQVPGNAASANIIDFGRCDIRWRHHEKYTLCFITVSQVYVYHSSIVKDRIMVFVWITAGCSIDWYYIYIMDSRNIIILLLLRYCRRSTSVLIRWWKMYVCRLDRKRMSFSLLFQKLLDDALGEFLGLLTSAISVDD